METVFECLMLSAFIIAVCALIYQFANNKSTNIKAESAVAWTTAAGLILA